MKNFEEKYNNNIFGIQLCREPHDFEVYTCDENSDNPYYMGFCVNCGYTVEITRKYLDEAFENDNDR